MPSGADATRLPKSRRRRATSWGALVLAAASLALVARVNLVGAEDAEESPRKVRIRVLGPDGEPVRSFRIDLRTEADGGGLSHIYSHDVEGPTTSLSRPGAPFRVRVSRAIAEDGARLAPWISEGLLGQERDAEVRLRSGTTIVGTVTSGKAPVALAEVAALAQGWDPTSELLEEDARDSTAEDGTFRLEGLEDRPYQIVVRPVAPHVAPPPAWAAAGAKDVKVMLRGDVERRVRVIDWQGRPVLAARVKAMRTYVLGPGRTWTSTAFLSFTDEKGEVEVRGLDVAETVRWFVTPPTVRNDLLTWEEERSLGEDLRVTLPRGYVVTVLFDPEPGDDKVVVRWSTPDGRHGGFSLPSGFPSRVDVPYGAVTFRASEMGAAPGPATTVTPKSPRAVLEVARRPQTVRLRVPDGAGREGALRRTARPGDSAEDLFDSRRTLRVGPDEWAQVPKIPPGPHEVWIPPTSADARCAYRADAPLGRSVTMELVPSRSIRVALVLPKGFTLPEVQVDGPLGDAIHAERDADGAFEAKGLPPGRWRVRVTVRTPDGTLRASAEVEAGEEVELVPK
jgi:hypothetical protein